MKTTKRFMYLICIFLSNSIFGQGSYTDDWFKNHCDYCNINTERQQKIVETASAWHNAHVSFANNKFKEAKRYILNDAKTNDTLIQLLEKHIFVQLEVENEAKKYFLSISNTNNKKIKQFVYKSLGKLYFDNKQYDSAFIYYNKAIKIEVPKTHFFTIEIDESKAFIYLSKENYKVSDSLYKKVLRLYKLSQDSIQIARNYSNLGNLYFEQYEDNTAKKYFDSAYIFSKPLKDLALKSTIAFNLHLIAEVSKEHEAAIKYFKEYTILNDSLQKQNAIWQVAQEKEAFNIAQKQTELDLKTAQRNTFIAISIGILLVLLIGFVFYRKLKQQHKQIQKLNKELNETNTVKNQLFTIIAHDLRSPVARLKQLFQLKAIKKEETTPTDKNVTQIIDSLSLLLDNLLNWSLSQSDLLSVQKEWFPLWQIVYQIELQYQSLIEEKNIQFSTNIEKSVLVYGDMEIFKIVIRNCLDNAIKFTPKDGKIMISGKIDTESFTVFITDSGIGIPEKVLKSIFEIKSNKSQKDTTGRKSSGLGLMLTKSMIQLNGGTIKIMQNPKGGTIVNISLPYKNVA
ncbi:tetratricopeptide repeat-containing sensor histidine kinase [Kordia sp.]|uniref:tetratricopeptide repeat-containing sensor histidine kinase n=1 Tax=Kordia sp. TaxID=1965332 RepID=UPI003B5BF675